jgi:peptidoglycan/LPS O-acetylase OafA/YrhL
MYLIHIFFFWLVYDKFKPWLTHVCDTAGLGGWRDTVGELLAFGATVAVASLLYRTVEMPFLRLKRRFTFVLSRD